MLNPLRNLNLIDFGISLSPPDTKNISLSRKFVIATNLMKNYSDNRDITKEMENISDIIFDLTQTTGLIATPDQALGIDLSALWQQTDLRPINLATR